MTSAREKHKKAAIDRSKWGTISPWEKSNIGKQTRKGGCAEAQEEHVINIPRVLHERNKAKHLTGKKGPRYNRT